MRIKDFTLNDLQNADTYRTGHTDNLKYKDEKYQVWLSRLCIGDYLPDTEIEAYTNLVTLEKLIKGEWRVAEIDYFCEHDGFDELRAKIVQMERNNTFPYTKPRYT